MGRGEDGGGEALAAASDGRAHLGNRPLLTHSQACHDAKWGDGGRPVRPSYRRTRPHRAPAQPLAALVVVTLSPFITTNGKGSMLA